MSTTSERFVAGSRIGIEALIALAHSNLAAWERFAALNFSATRRMLEDGINYAKAVLNAKNPQELAQISVGATSPMLEQMISYSRSLYQLATESQTEFARLFEGQTGRLNQNLAGLLDSIGQNAAAGSQAAVAATKSALDAANTVQEGFAKAAKEATEAAERSVAEVATAAQETASRAVKQAAEQSKRKGA
jgi:phasin family protein